MAILVGIFAYLIIGFSFNLVIGLVYKRFDESSFIYTMGDTDGDADYILINVLLWPMALLVIILGLMPFLIKKMYVLFVAIIFSIVALIKKGEK